MEPKLILPTNGGDDMFTIHHRPPVRWADDTTPRRPPTLRLVAAEDLADHALDGHFVVPVEQQLHAAARQLEVRRAEAISARMALTEAEHVAAAARDQVGDARRRYEEARAVARRADVILRQQRRAGDDANLELRHAHEWLAQLEGADAAPARPDGRW